MKKNRNVNKDTTDSRVYKMTAREKELSCTFCPPNKGCNGTNRFSPPRNWKRYRKTQWR